LPILVFCTVSAWKTRYAGFPGILSICESEGS
jgi:hypothetical protein